MRISLIGTTIVLVAALAPSSGFAKASYQGALRIELSGDGRHATLLEPYAFVDDRGQRWDVPKDAMVDGASIPQSLWSIVGGPFDGLYRNASVIHDWYCDRRSRPWRDVHRMFYDAMIASGVPTMKAKIMYLAVVWGGPRWDDQAIHNAQLPPMQQPPRNAQDAKVRYYNLKPAAHHPGAESTTLAMPSVEARFNRMVTQVATDDASLDQIDQIAQTDPGNLIVEVTEPPMAMPGVEPYSPDTTTSTGVTASPQESPSDTSGRN